MLGSKLKFYVQHIFKLKLPKATPKASVKKIRVGMHKMIFIIDVPSILCSIAHIQSFRSAIQSWLKVDFPLIAE